MYCRNVMEDEIRSKVSGVVLQLSELKRRLDEACAAVEHLEEQKKRLHRDLEAAHSEAEERASSLDKAERNRVRLQQELEDLLVELENQRQLSTNLDKKQRRFDQVSGQFTLVSDSFT